MPKLSNALAASALLVALSAPCFAAELSGSASQRNSTTIQNRGDAGIGVNTRTGTSTQMNDRDDVHGSASLNGSASVNSNPALNRDRDSDRPQSAQTPSKDRDDMNGSGRSSSSPGHEMQEHGSVPGSPGASGYAPGHR